MSDSLQNAPQDGIRQPKPWRALLVVIVLLAAVVALLWFWRASRDGGPGYVPPGAIDVVATTLVAEPAPVSLPALGELQAVHEVTLAGEVAGRIAMIAFESGQTAKAGSVLVQLDDATEQADLAAAKAALTFASQQLERTKGLAATGDEPRQLLQLRQAEHDQARAQVQQLEARIRQKRIRAPFSGELGLRRVNLGQYLNAGDAAVTLTDLETLHVNFDLPQQELTRLRVGQTVEVHTDTPGEAPVQGHINAIEPQVGRDTRNATIQATLSNAQRALRPGMYVTVAVVLPPEPDALLLPATAVITSASGASAAVVRGVSAEGIGKAEIVPITAGRSLGDRVIVTRGLQAGDIVVTEGQLRIQPGATVRIVEKTAAGS